MQEFSHVLTLLEVCNIVTPVGMNATPMATKIATTLNGVIMGCQAFSLCCLNASLGGLLDFSAGSAIVTEDYFNTERLKISMKTENQLKQGCQLYLASAQN